MSNAELLRAMQALEKAEKENFASKFKPYDSQLEFLNSLSSTICLLGGNRCLSGDTEIYDPIAKIKRRVDSIEGDFHVWAWDGAKAVVAKAHKPYRKPEARIHRVLLSTGEYFDCSEAHLVLSPSGWLAIGNDPLEFCAIHPRSTVDTYPSTHASDVDRCLKTTQDSLFGCHHSDYSCGEQPLLSQGGVQDALPLPADALQHNRNHSHDLCPVCEPCSTLDLQDQSKQVCNHQHQFELLPSIQDAPDLISVPFFDSSTHSTCRISIPVSDLCPEVHQSLRESSPLPAIEQSVPSATDNTYLRLFVALSSSSLPITTILHSRYLRNDYVWDFEVEVYGNYIHAGVIHHNSGKTFVGSFAIMCHATGNYPSWWRGIRFTAPVDIWIAGVTSQRVRDTVQEKLFGKLGRMGTGMIPKNAVVESSVIKKTGTPMAIDRIDVKHISGGFSNIQFFSYEMDREKFQGSSVSLVWFDEEPPEDIYNECKMRVLDTSGYIMFTFTPLSGITPLYDGIMQDDSIHKIWLSMDDAKHLKKDDIDRLLDGMSDAEKLARRHGKATIGAGKVFQFAEEEYTIEPFEIPPYWRRLGGLDVGLTHPTGAVMAAIDDDASTIYITNEYRVQNKTAIDHAAHLKHWGVKFVIDPSAFNRQIGSGVSTASIYQDEGLDLTKANNNVESSISEIRKLMGSGRLFIFSTCHMLLKELRTYRTRESSDGKAKIVKVDDDLIDPLRYVCLSMDELAEAPKRFQEKIKIKPFKAADSKVGY